MSGLTLRTVALWNTFRTSGCWQMAPVTKVAVYSFLAIWSFFVLFPIYWVITFKDAAAVNEGPNFIPFIDFQPTLDAGGYLP